MTTTGTLLHGFVHRENGEAIVEARVFFSASPVDVPDVALLTDARGRFTLHAPIAGRYEVACQADGLASARVPIDVAADQEDIDIDIGLGPVTD